MKTVVIQSIGSANPSVTNLLAKAFGVNHLLLAKIIYNAPFVFLDKVDEETSHKAHELLTDLGLDAKVYDHQAFKQPINEPLDVAVYVNDPYEVVGVSKELARFLGCNEQESLSLLLNESSVVLGGVSLATAKVLQSRLNTDVIATNPKKDLYTLVIDSEDKLLYQEISSWVHKFGLRFINDNTVENLTYEQSQKLWGKFRAKKRIQLFNQSFRRFEIDLLDFDLDDNLSTEFLIKQIGMPSDELQIIHNQLPVKLDESLNVKHANEKIQIYSQNGLSCKMNAIPFGKFKIKIKQIKNHHEVERIINQFYRDEKLNLNETKWVAPLPLDSLLNRFMEKQLSQIGCDVECEYS